jgi:predicted transposase YbfD/YdcC
MAKRSGKLAELSGILSENNITAETIELNDEIIFEMKKKASMIKEYRHESYTRHLLVDVVMITFFAMLGNANEWSDIEVFAKEKEKWLKKYLELPYGIPTDDTIRLIISNIDSTQFYRLTVSFLMETIDKMLNIGGVETELLEADIIAVDGKESKGSKRSQTDKRAERALQTLNVYSTSYRMCLAQKFIDGKTNEIPAAQEILRLMDRKGDIVTADAMNCQKETASAITKSGGDYVLAIKGNQKLFYEEVKEYFDGERLAELRKKANNYHKTIEKEHSGIGTREYYISEDISWFKEREKWAKLKTFGMVKKTHKKKSGETIIECRYYICSIPADAELFSRAARGHWGVENNLHWSLDFTFKDDKNTSMAKTGAKNMQIMKKIVLSVLEIVKASYKLSMAKIRYKISLNYETGIEKLLSLLSVESVEKALLKR